MGVGHEGLAYKKNVRKLGRKQRKIIRGSCMDIKSSMLGRKGKE